MVTPANEVKTQSDIREELEKKVLTFMAASTYEALPSQLANERGITFTPLVPETFDEKDPAASSNTLVIDYEHSDPAPEKGNMMMSDSKKDNTQLFDVIYDLTNRLVIKLNISNGLENGPSILKLLSVSNLATIGQFSYEMASLLRIMQGGSVKTDFNSFVLAARDNRKSLDRR